MDAPKVSPVEVQKRDSAHLRGSIAEELLNTEPSFSRSANGLLKFHGTYQQDDRDLRRTSPAKVYSMMVRVGIPGGVLNAGQYLALDALAGTVGNGDLRVTSRQDIQYHGVLKGGLKPLIAAIHATGLSTWAACGDVVRNVTCDTTPARGRHHAGLAALASRLRVETFPRSAAYAEIWLDGERAASLEIEREPLYGDVYLPRKFKFAFTCEGENLIDIYANDLGFVAHYDGDTLAGYTVLAGGGLGQSAGVKATFARLADPVAFIGPEDDGLFALAFAAVGIHRDFGNRENRKLARLKYVIAERGVAWFREELERRLGCKLADPRPLTWHRQNDYLGWHQQDDGRMFYGLRVVSGRLKGELRAAVREVVRQTGCQVRFTVQQNVLLTDIDPGARAEVERILGVHTAELPPVLRHAMACVSLPTCPQAITEAERVLPQTAAALQRELDAAGAAGQTVNVRMTGCSNGCVRPYLAEIGIVGESVGQYTIYLGGSPYSDRLARPWKHLVKLDEIAATLRPLFDRYVAERKPGEAFGDWWTRVE